MTDNANVAVINGVSYNTGLTLLTQQLQSEMRSAITLHPKSVVGTEMAFTDFIGVKRGKVKTGRNEDIVTDEADRSRRAIIPESWVDGELYDSVDKLKNATDVTSSLMKAQSAGAARHFDKVVITAALGTAYGGKAGTTGTALPGAQLVPAGGAGMTLAKFLSAARILKTGLVIKRGSPIDIHIAWTARQEYEFQNITEVKSSDFANSKVLADGGVDVFYKVMTHLIEDITDAAADRMLPYDGTTRKTMMWAKAGIEYAVWEETNGAVDWVPPKRSWLVSAAQTIGAVRTQDGMVVEIDCVESHA